MIDKRPTIKEIIKIFVKLGFIGFGGPAVHIAMMQQEVVVKKKWMSEEHFLDLLGATNLIPGPNSTEMAIHIGYDKGGWKGLLAAGLSFILPAVLITGILAWLYKIYGLLPEIQPFIYGIKPAVIAIIIGAVYPLAIKSMKTVFLCVIGTVVFTASLLGINEFNLMIGAGLLSLTLYISISRKVDQFHSITPITFLAPILTADNTKLFWIFIKIGSVLYGSGYVLFAFLDTELVGRGLLSNQQLMDAIAIGQFTPGPVFSSVTFIGYQINGISGAVISTIAIFLPSFVFVALVSPLMKIMRKAKHLAVFLDGVNVASVAIIAAVCITMGKEAVTDWRTIVIGLVSIVVVFRYKHINSAFIVFGGAVFGYCLHQL